MITVQGRKTIEKEICCLRKCFKFDLFSIVFHSKEFFVCFFLLKNIFIFVFLQSINWDYTFVQLFLVLVGQMKMYI